MFQKGPLLVALSLLVVVPTGHAAAGGWSVSVGGGLGIPVGDFSDGDRSTGLRGLDASMGWAISPAVDYMINDVVSVGIDGTFAGNNLNPDDRDAIRTAEGDPNYDIKYTQMGGGIHGKYWLPMQSSPVSVYLVVGAGVTNFKKKVESDDPLLAWDLTKAGFTGRGGIGAGYKVGAMVTVGLEGDYSFVSLKEGDFGVSSAPWFGVKAAIAFMMPGAK